MPSLKLLGTDGCHLCEQAELIIAEALSVMPEQITLQTIDIAIEEHWQKDYAIRIPVLIDQTGQKEIAWPFDLPQITHFIKNLTDD